MGTKKNSEWLGVPWGWVLVSAYCTTLVCVAVSQAAGAEAALAFVREFQTLIAGLATIAALLIAVQQLKRQSVRDVVDAVRHYEAEIDAMVELDSANNAVFASAGGLANMFGSMGFPIPLDQSRWQRLQHQTNVSLARPIQEVLRAVDDYNQLSEQTLLVPFRQMAQHQTNELSIAIRIACKNLSSSIVQRRAVVRQLIEAAR